MGKPAGRGTGIGVVALGMSLVGVTIDLPWQSEAAILIGGVLLVALGCVLFLRAPREAAVAKGRKASAITAQYTVDSAKKYEQEAVENATLARSNAELVASEKARVEEARRELDRLKREHAETVVVTEKLLGILDGIQERYNWLTQTLAEVSAALSDPRSLQSPIFLALSGKPQPIHDYTDDRTAEKMVADALSVLDSRRSPPPVGMRRLPIGAHAEVAARLAPPG